MDLMVIPRSCSSFLVSVNRLERCQCLLLAAPEFLDLRFACLRSGNDTGSLDEGIGESRLAVVDVGNDGHVSDLVRVVHQTPDLFDPGNSLLAIGAWLQLEISYVKFTMVAVVGGSLA